MSSEKEYKSLFDPSIQIDVYNFITETLIRQRLEISKKHLPKCPFWRKEYQTNDYLKWLGELYQAELSEVRKICKVFSPKAIIDGIRSTKIFSIRYSKIDARKSFIYAIYLAEIKNAGKVVDEPIEKPQQTNSTVPVAKKLNKGSMLSL